MKLVELIAVVEALNARVVVLEEALKKASDRRGPKSEREMTDDDARAIMGEGEDAKLSHKAAAEKRNLSYAQVYSCRKGFTFKHIHKEILEAQKKS
jgi:hypothetical protein